MSWTAAGGSAYGYTCQKSATSASGSVISRVLFFSSLRGINTASCRMTRQERRETVDYLSHLMFVDSSGTRTAVQNSDCGDVASDSTAKVNFGDVYTTNVVTVTVSFVDSLSSTVVRSTQHEFGLDTDITLLDGQ